MIESSIIRILQGYQSHTNTADLKRLEKEVQIKEIQPPKTDRILSVSDRALYHKLTSLNIYSYQCSNVYINVEKRASINKDIQ